MKLDKNKTYFLGRLTKKEKRELFDFLKDSTNIGFKPIFKVFNKFNYIFYDKYTCAWTLLVNTGEESVCAKELFNHPLILKNVQVDCLGLSIEQINKAFDVYLKAGYKYYKSETEAKNIHAGQCTILIANENKEVVLVSPQQHEVVEDHIMEYDKFMELFGSKPKGYWLVDIDPDCKKWLAYLDFEKEIIYGIDMYGKSFYSKNNRKFLHGSESIANQALVFKRLQEYAIKLGFAESENNRFTLNNNIFYLGNLPIMKDGVWMDVEKEEQTAVETFNPQPHYDNSKGSLYKVATERNWNSYIFDVVKRLERGDKKDPLKQEIEKSIDVLKIWLSEL